ncbi:hypothetical protein H2199_005041 [Coniosporium tulheliwenetii]|uniref:Uncharacterized protein n=1 Tax=Coniosporium tulheliwenetii TaxID=3383036 RepID=A0ACC2Z2U9_9PEZI|nr:hypothetical protein H2199_005041 [Cladosporium sp. JES 115]
MASTDERSPSRASTPPTNMADSASDSVQLTITHHGSPHTFTFPSDATITDLSTAIESTLSIPPSNQKLLIAPKTGLLRPPFKDPSLPLSSLTSKKITLMGSTVTEVSTLQSAVTKASTPRTYGGIKPASPSPSRDPRRAQEEALYTFTTLRPLPYLPHPERSLRFLERLRDDPGIRSSMRRHKAHDPRVADVRSEPQPGEVIELRLRTDAYDGYRDYKTIRRTLCHELAHNLCKEIEREVERDDWTRGGRSVGGEEFYEPSEGEVHDHGGWTGGEFVLGSGGGGETVVSSAGGQVDAGG